MATSIADLLGALDYETSRAAGSDPADAARALQATGGLLSRLREDGIGADTARIRDDVVRRLADACALAAITFDGTPGRVTDLLGVTSDAVGRLQPELTDSDRWAIATSLATTSRRCAGAIAKSRPHATVPQLLGVADRSRELIRVAAISPPSPEELAGHHQPIPLAGLPRGLSPAGIAAESMAELVAIFRSRARDAMTIRQLLAICHAAEQTATASQVALAHTGSPLSRSALATARIWSLARQGIDRFADQPRRRTSDGSRTLLCAARVHEATRHLCGGDTGSTASVDVLRSDELAFLRAAVSQLPRLAAGCESELAHIANTLVVSGGSRPLHEDRTEEWLRRQAFLVHPPDLAPSNQLLHRAAAISRRLTLELDRAIGTDTSRANWSQRRKEPTTSMPPRPELSSPVL